MSFAISKAPTSGAAKSSFAAAMPHIPKSSMMGVAVASFPRTQISHNIRASKMAVCATAAPANQKIRIKLKSYWVDLLQDSVDKIMDAATTTGATIAGPVPLPTR